MLRMQMRGSDVARDVSHHLIECCAVPLQLISLIKRLNGGLIETAKDRLCFVLIVTGRMRIAHYKPEHDDML